MASQKLTFLQKVEEKHVKKAMDARGAGGSDAPATAPSGPTSADVFRGIGIFLGQNPDIPKGVGKVFQFKLSEPDSVWTIDASGDTGVTEGETIKPDCTLELTDADFVAMTKGEKDPQKMYFGGELKIGGDIMASQKLTFLQKVEEKHVTEAMKNRPSGGETKAAPKKAAKEPFAPKLMDSLTVKKNGGAKVQLLVTDPDGAWFVDLGEGSVKPGTYEGADTTLTLDDESLAELAKGEADAATLFQKGKLRVDGDLAPARDLGWLRS